MIKNTTYTKKLTTQQMTTLPELRNSWEKPVCKSHFSRCVSTSLVCKLSTSRDIVCIDCVILSISNIVLLHCKLTSASFLWCLDSSASQNLTKLAWRKILIFVDCNCLSSCVVLVSKSEFSTDTCCNLDLTDVISNRIEVVSDLLFCEIKSM